MDMYLWAAPIGLAVMILYIAIGGVLFQVQEIQEAAPPDQHP